MKGTPSGDSPVCLGCLHQPRFVRSQPVLSVRRKVPFSSHLHFYCPSFPFSFSCDPNFWDHCFVLCFPFSPTYPGLENWQAARALHFGYCSISSVCCLVSASISEPVAQKSQPPSPREHGVAGGEDRSAHSSLFRFPGASEGFFQESSSQ